MEVQESMAEKLFVIAKGDSVRTFAYDDKLPSLPLPSLHHTLERYVESTKPFLTAEELAVTIRIVSDFEKGVGKKLQAELLKRAKQEKNWLERWWEEMAYLKNRQPLLPFSSMMGLSMSQNFRWKTGRTNSQIKNAAIFCYYTIDMWLLLRKQRLRPDLSRDGKKHFSMYGFKRLYNCVRLAGEHCDSMSMYFRTESEGSCPSHIIVLHNGHIFTMNVLHKSGDSLTPPELEHQLLIIKDKCYERGPGIPILTCTDRTTWSKNRRHLEVLSVDNRLNLNIIDTAMFVLCLDQDYARTTTEIIQLSFSGEMANRWTDKSMNCIFFQNGVDCVVSEHSAYDGMISIMAMVYVYLRLSESNWTWQGTQSIRDLSEIRELEFKYDSYIEDQVKKTEVELQANKSCVIFLHEKFTGYGKELIQSFKIHPDTFVQMALQLAYYTMHGRPAPTYETATTREFYHGRTETVRSCTVEVVEWVKAMLNPDMTNSERRDLLKFAVEKHTQLMKEAKQNAGCDRHLLGLYCIAMQQEIDIPEIFIDPAFVKSGGNGNFILSTSLVGYSPLGGAAIPMCKDGYGCFYNIGQEIIDFSLSVYRDSYETSAHKFYKNLTQSLEDMKRIMEEISASHL